jgi:hypothetical protein
VTLLFATEHLSSLVTVSEVLGKILLGVAAVLTPIGVISGAYWARKGLGHARSVDDSVNHIHASGGERLYDMVLNNQQTATSGIRAIVQGQDMIHERLGEIENRVHTNNKNIITLFKKVDPHGDYEDEVVELPDPPDVVERGNA